MSAKRFSLDANVLIYFFDPRDPMKQSAAQHLIRMSIARDCWIGLQAVGEFYAATTRKNILTRADATQEALSFLTNFNTFPATPNAHRRAAHEALAGRFSYWDAVMLGSAAEAGCALLLSEDMQDGMTVGSLTIRNPFGPAGLSAAAAAALAP
ncbi:MAG TPA: PIN domain-containing protein [Rhizomicrobium sp.]|jgi:predicted nucleic acid-binding protein|nr:PIN domain-containing protein [Rhizomicrobium sp.]